MLRLLIAHGWASSWERLAVAAALTLGFAVLARSLRGVSRSGALAGGLACFLLFAGAGPAAFATLAALLRHDLDIDARRVSAQARTGSGRAAGRPECLASPGQSDGGFCRLDFVRRHWKPRMAGRAAGRSIRSRHGYSGQRDRPTPRRERSHDYHLETRSGRRRWRHNDLRQHRRPGSGRCHCIRRMGRWHGSSVAVLDSGGDRIRGNDHRQPAWSDVATARLD